MQGFVYYASTGESFPAKSGSFCGEKGLCNWSTDLLTESFYNVFLLVLPPNMLNTNI